MRIERELMRGAGPLAVLKLLEDGPKYGYELVDLLTTRTAGVLEMGQSTLYPLLYNLEAQSLVESYEAAAPNGRNRRYYRLTVKGQQRLARDVEQWQHVCKAMTQLGVLTSRRLNWEGGLA